MTRIVEVHAHRPGTFEVVERKGRGHPDTICDAIAEELSIALTRDYVERCGRVFHHNVDKVLLRGGAARPEFGGGEVLEPIELYVAGRATRRIGDAVVPVGEIVVDTARAWLRANLRGLDVERHVRVHDLVRPGSVDLVGLFDAGRESRAPPANDSSIGVGFAPPTRLERVVLAVERDAQQAGAGAHPAFGEDVKVLGVRVADSVELTVACAHVDRHVASVDDYAASVASLGELAASTARREGFAACRVSVNSGDDVARGRCYLTVTGTSAESGDDGEVGRGNRVGGLITPHRPMTMEAAAGKNAITHVGKLYNVLARRIAEEIVAEVEEVRAAQVFLASQIGRRIDDPHAVHVQLELADGGALSAVRARVDEVVDAGLATAPVLWSAFLERSFAIY